MPRFFSGLCFLIILLFIVMSGGCAVRATVDPTDVVGEDALKSGLRAALRHGDWLVVRGVGAADNMFATITNMPLSHAAIYDAERDEVIESDAEGVHTTSLDEFLARSHRVIVMQPMWATPGNRPAAVRQARSLIGKGYNFTGIVGLNSPDRYYCTQVAINAYMPFMTQKPQNPIPHIIKPGQMYHWGRIIYDSGP